MQMPTTPAATTTTMSSRASPRSQGYPDDGGSRRSAHRRSVSAPNATVNTAAERGGGPESIHPSQHEFEIERPSTTLDGEFPVPPARELQQLTRSVTTHGAVACAASNSRGSSYTHSSYNYYPPHVHQHQPYFQQHQQYQHRGAPSLPPNPVRQPPAVGGVDPHHQQLHLHQHRVPSPSPHSMPQPHSHAHAHAHTPHIHQHSFGPLQQWQWQQRVYPHQHQHQPQQQLRGHITCSELERTTWAQQQQQHQHQQTWTLQDQQDMPWFGYDDDAAADLNEPYDEQRAPCMMDPHQYHQYEEATTPANCRTYPPHIQVTLGKEHITRAVPIMPMPMPVPAAGDVAEMEGTFASSPSASASASATSDPARAAEQRQQWVAWSENREGEASEGARQICAIATAQDLWKFLADYPILALGPNESLHLSLEGVRPLYTDKRNRHGGHVAVALPVGHATQQYWNHATYAMVTGALPFQEQITGMRAVRKADGLSVQLWITDSKAESAVRAIKNYLRHRASPTTIISFCPHKCIMQTLRQRPARGGPR